MLALVIGGIASGVGKTTLTLGLIAALRARGLSVQPFKVGPDYIDPSHHAQAAGRPSRNLDSWMVPEPALCELFWRAAAHADAAIVEGVMGLFDGRTGGGEIGSTAHVAKMLGLPVLLVVDAAKAARSVAATVLGCQVLGPDLRIIGVVLNNVASARHAEIGREAIESLTNLPVLGWLTRDLGLQQEERYLGLVPAGERPLPATLIERAMAQVEQQIDLSRLLQLANVEKQAPPASGIFPSEPPAARARIAIARDAAFNFYYEDSLDLLSAWGADLMPFSPLNDAAVPSDADAVYLGGGFPELFAAELAANTPMLASIREAAAARLPIYAECGGLMYLQEQLIDAREQPHRLVGTLPGSSTLVGKRLTLGYREARARRSSLLATAGQMVRGHEFHWSVAEPPPPEQAAYDILGGQDRVEGVAAGSVLASYLHVHLASSTGLAPRFVQTAVEARQTREVSGGEKQNAPPASRIIPPHRAEGKQIMVSTSQDDLSAAVVPHQPVRNPTAQSSVGGTRVLFGLPEALYNHDGSTAAKPEVRAIILSKLQLRPGGVLWDVGAASGAVSIEAAGLIPGLTAHAIERSEIQLRRLWRNVGTRTSDNRVRVVKGDAPEIFRELPDPDAVFVGGSGGRLTAILTDSRSRLRPNGRIVCNLVSIEHLAEALGWGQSNRVTTEIVQVSVSRGTDIIGMTRLQADDPVAVVTFSA